MPANTLRRCRAYSRSTSESATLTEATLGAASIIRVLGSQFSVRSSQFLIHPAPDVRTRGRRPLDPPRHGRHIPLVDGAAADVVRVLGIAGEAVLAALAVDDFRFGRRGRAAEEFLH